MNQRNTGRRWPCDWWQRQRLDWCIYKPRNIKGCLKTPETRRSKEGFSLTIFRGSIALLTHWFQMSNLQNYETINFFCNKPHSSWYCATVALANSHKSMSPTDWLCPHQWADMKWVGSQTIKDEDTTWKVLDAHLEITQDSRKPNCIKFKKS